MTDVLASLVTGVLTAFVGRSKRAFVAVSRFEPCYSPSRRSGARSTGSAMSISLVKMRSWRA